MATAACVAWWLFILAAGSCLIAVISNRGRFYIKWMVFISASFFSVTFAIPFMLPRPLDYRNALIPAFALRQISRFVLGLTWSLHGLDNLVKDSGCVMVINHQSALDLLVMTEIWPMVGNCTVVVKKAIFYIWPFGLGSYLWGTLFIDRSDRKASQDSINQTARAIKEKKAKLCIFPEGTRHEGKELLPFKKGAFYVAINNQCPIQPVVVSRYYWLDGKKKKFDSGHNLITFLPAISTEGLGLKDIDDLIRRTHDVMSAAYKDTSAKALRMRSRSVLGED